MFRLVALDLDNTLIGPDLTLSARVKAAIAAAQARGVRVTIATGRGPAPTEQFAQALNLETPLICFQGGIVYDHRTRQILHETRLDPAMIPVIVQLAEARGWNLQFETPNMIYLPRNGNHPEVLLDLMRVADWQQVDNLVTDMPVTPHKFILAVHDPAERGALETELRAATQADPRLAGLTIVPSHPILVEGLPGGLSKATGLAWLARYLGIAQSEVLAVGDNDNDAEMLRWAGLGVAMAESSPAALAAADWVAPGVADDGAAAALERFV